MLLSNQFLELFREETYAVNLALYDDKELMNPFDNILAKDPITGVWTKQYSVVPIGELGGRKEAEPIPQKNMVMGYTCYGAQSIEASGKVNLSKKLQQRSREFTNGNGTINEAAFAGHLSDSIGRGFLTRRAQKWHKLAARIFNFGGIQAGNAFFNQFTRSEGFSDIPNSPLIYDGRPLFALPANAHPSYAAGATSGVSATSPPKPVKNVRNALKFSEAAVCCLPCGFSNAASSTAASPWFSSATPFCIWRSVIVSSPSSSTRIAWDWVRFSPVKDWIKLPFMVLIFLELLRVVRQCQLRRGFLTRSV